MKYCKICNKEVSEDLMFCPDCGTLIMQGPANDIYDGNTITVGNLDITKPGVMKIVNKRTGEVYVSWSYNMENTIDNHITDLKNESHHNKDLERDYSKGDRFNFILLEEAGSRNKTELKRLYKKWVDIEDSFHHGYNRNDSGGYESYEYKPTFNTGGRLKDKKS